jgi:hypothetical protein
MVLSLAFFYLFTASSSAAFFASRSALGAPRFILGFFENWLFGGISDLIGPNRIPNFQGLLISVFEELSGYWHFQRLTYGLYLKTV